MSEFSGSTNVCAFCMCIHTGRCVLWGPLATIEAAPPQTGWICPKCSRGIAPSVQVCPCTSAWTLTASAGISEGK